MNSIKILTWNICFGAVTADNVNVSNLDITAQTLAKKCQSLINHKSKDSCIDNTINFIIKDDYDFIGLQEASNYLYLIKNILKHKQNYGVIHSKAKISNSAHHADLLTFYNKKRFKINFIKAGNLSDIINEEYIDGRPYQIIFFEEIKTKKKFIIINIHYKFFNKTSNRIINFTQLDTRKISREELEEKLSNNFSNCLSITKYDDTIFLDVDSKQNNNSSKLNLYIDKNVNNLNTIILGDFNDHGYSDYWRGIFPFRYIHKINNKLKNLMLSANIDILDLKTCCVGKHNLRNVKINDKKEDSKIKINKCNINIEKNKDRYYGDYILIDNDKLYFKIKNTIPKELKKNANKYPTSDHLPVTATIGFKQTGGNIHDIYYHKYLKYKAKYLAIKKN